jgi:tetratricopeptide (TPR) repeat protein
MMASASPATDKPDHESTRPTERRKVKRQLNIRLLVGTLIAVAVAGPAAYFWREFQVKRTAGSFLSRADRLEKEEEWTEAAGHLFRYLQLRPDDANVRIRLAETFGKSADQNVRLKSRAVNLYYRALSVASEEEQPALRSSLTDLLLESQQLVAAETEAKKLLEGNPDDPQGLRVLALAHYRQYLIGSRTAKSEDGISIGEELEGALERDPGNVVLARTLAWIYRTEPLLLSEEKQPLTESERKKLANDVMDQMVEANAEDATAYLARYLYRNEYELAGAEEDLETALKKTPDDLKALLLAADHARQKALRILREGSTNDAKKAGDELLTAASEYYSHIISEVAPEDERAYTGLGDILSLRGKTDEAILTWRKGLAAGNANSILLNLRLAEVLLVLGRIEPAEEAVNALSTAVDKRVAALPRPMRLSLERSINMLRGRCFAANGESQNAIVELKRVLASRPSSEAEVRQTLQAEMLLGNIYASLSEWDLSAAAFERAATLQPELAAPRLAAAASAARFKPEAAIRHYEMALALGDPASGAGSNGQAVTGVQRAEAWFALAHAHFQKQRKLPEEDRNWRPYRKAIGLAMSKDGEMSLPNAWRADLLQADHLALVGEEKADRQQGMRDAVEQLRQAEEKYPDSKSLLLGLVSGFERFGASEDADRALEKLEGLTGKSASTCVLRANLYSSRKQYDKAREILEKGLEVLPSEDHPTLSRALARVGLSMGDVEASQGQLLALHKKDPTNRGLIRQLLELAFERKDLPSVEQWEQKLRDLEGANSPYADYSKVRRLLAGATDQDDPRFSEGAKLLSDVERRLPNSPQIRMLRGMILQARGERREAIKAFQDTIRLGMQTVSVYERLIALLGEEKQFDEARTYLARAKGRGISSQRLGTLEIAIAAGANQLDRAEELARVAAEENPESASATLNHAQMLAANKKPEEATAAFQEAIRRAPTDLRTYGALFNFYLQTEHKDLARQTLGELEENVDLARGELVSVLAESYDRLGDVEKAAANYREARRLDPENTVKQMRLANFLIRSDKADEAEAILRDVVEKDPRADAARYRLADILVTRGGKKEWQEALKLLEKSGTDENVFNLDRRLQALLLVRRAGRKNLEKARDLLEGLVLNTQNPADADRLLLAQVYEAEISRLQGEGDAAGVDEVLGDAKEQYTAVVNRANPNPSHLALFVEFLIRNDETGAASGYLDRLDKLTPDNLGTTRLRARWLHGENRTQEIKPLVESLAEKLLKKIVDDPRTEARLTSNIGNVYSSVELYQEAERWYRRLVELDSTGYMSLVKVLARQDRMPEAIDVCIEAAQSDQSTRPASLLASLLVTEKASEEEFQQAEPVLKGAMEDHPDDVALLLNLANLRVSRKQIDEADKLYQRVIELEPKNLIALNNRATLLSELPEKSEEALETIDRAIELAGEHPAFLDTKGMILIHDGKPKQAVPFLETAAYSTDSDPRYHFHLAVGHVRNGDLDKARDALREANRGDLKNQFLTEMDLQLLDELEGELGN